jgi:hypothetical protein
LGRFADALVDLDHAASLDDDWMLPATLAELRQRIEESQSKAMAINATADISGPASDVSR